MRKADIKAGQAIDTLSESILKLRQGVDQELKKKEETEAQGAFERTHKCVFDACVCVCIYIHVYMHEAEAQRRCRSAHTYIHTYIHTYKHTYRSAIERKGGKGGGGRV